MHDITYQLQTRRRNYLIELNQVTRVQIKVITRFSTFPIRPSWRVEAFTKNSGRPVLRLRVPIQALVVFVGSRRDALTSFCFLSCGSIGGELQTDSVRLSFDIRSETALDITIHSTVFLSTI
ncbi:uncharacterized protein DFL_005629 [Arthrobotrys flagrans]|uniref:Uncharacterized protein n=1 Tax=Arthrobotrys flagrans TaxID=97331 RepID=A0A436ZYN2_ARTFL|nr:hypothetical protein DFL_005629 [Arthrobotrys flagrans]